MTYIAIHAKAECMTLSKMMQSKLPRELRDMVYAHLLPRKTYTTWGHLGNLWWLNSLQTTSYDHLFTHGYVPLDTMKEIGEMWYEVSTFMVPGFPSGRGSNPSGRGSNPEVASLGLDFLLQDTLGLDIDVHQHVKHIYIRFDYVEGVDENVTQLDANLRRLLPLGVNARVVVYLQCLHRPSSTLRRQQVVALVSKLQSIFPVLEELVEGGKRVMVNVKGYNVFDVKVERLNAPTWISQFTKVLSDEDLRVLWP